MLQQTQVERVIPRYLAWLERWPTPDALAAASPADVIREWQGLGYNRRASACTARRRRSPIDGWPDDLTELPGVGPYTAAAVRNFAFGEPVLPVDTNVARVQERTGHDSGRSRAGADGSRRDRVSRPRPALRRLPARRLAARREGRRYEPLRKQSRFEGSFRQRRARCCGSSRGPQPLAALDARPSNRSCATVSSSRGTASSSRLPA